MGLDINLLGRPHGGYEDEFYQLWSTFEAERSGKPLPSGPFVNASRKGILGFGSKRSIFDKEAAVARFQEICDPAYVTIKAPRVGHDPEADAWLLDLFAQGRIQAQSEAAALSQFDGYYALEVMPACDGFPIYSNGGAYKGVDRTSFRGAFLSDCIDVLGDDLVAQAWVGMTASTFKEWAKELRQVADAFAQSHALQAVLGDREFHTDDLSSNAHKLHIIDQCARWALFWSDLGHGSEPYF